MNTQAHTIARHLSNQPPEHLGVQQEQQVFDLPPHPGLPNNFRQQQIAQQKANLNFQQRMAVEQANGASLGPPHGPPSGLQMPPSYYHAQMFRQRQATAAAQAAAANWSAQQDRQANVNQSPQRLGSAILRLLNFSEQLNSFPDTTSLEAWTKFVNEFYIDPAMCTQSLPNNPELSYELPTPLLPAYYHQLHREIVKLNLTFHDAREYYLPPQNHVVECPKCTMCYYFRNATKVEILGKLRIVYRPGMPPNSLLKMQSWEFIGEEWDEWICRMPPPPIKASREEADRANGERETEKVSDSANGDGCDVGGAGLSSASFQDGAELDKKKRNSVSKDAATEGEGEDNDDHEELFGPSPTESHQGAESRPPSRGDPEGMDAEDERTKDPNKRARMVLLCGVTARHLRFLEISDVLGQLSPLFGPRNPNETLSALLQNIPGLPNHDVSRKVNTDVLSTTKNSTQKGSRPGSRHAANSSQKIDQIQSGRAMQQQAAQVLQKQAAQTLSQAMPPAKFDFGDHDFGEEDDLDMEAQDGTDPVTDTDDLFRMDRSSTTETANGQSVKVEDADENEHNSINDHGKIDLRLDVDLDADAEGERDLDFNVETHFSLGDDSPPLGTKRVHDEGFRRNKRQRNTDSFS